MKNSQVSNRSRNVPLRNVLQGRTASSNLPPPYVHYTPPTIDTRNKLDLLRDFGEQGSPISTKKLQNKVDMARHGLILRQHGATTYTELLEAYFGNIVLFSIENH